MPKHAELETAEETGEQLQRLNYKFGDDTPVMRKTKWKAPHLRLKRLQTKHWKRFHPIWQRIEGEWKRYVCRKCKSVSFKVLDQEAHLVKVECVQGHRGLVLAGFTMEQPE